MTETKANFVEIENSYTSLLEFGESKKINIKGNGVVYVRATNKEEKIINDVFYSPGITHNLIEHGTNDEEML